MQRKLFGTDGIRGEANKEPMTAEIALQLGKALAQLENAPLTVVIGKDTRVSGYLFESALTAGLCSAGAKVFLVGPLPTPAIAHITRSFGADVGIVISASHNPAAHNGIKLFDGQGYKFPDVREALLEQKIMAGLNSNGGAEAEIGKVVRIDDARGRYIEFAKATIKDCSLKGLRVVLDCANGAAYSVAPVIMKELGAEVITLNNHPDGHNINRNCGAMHPEVIQEAVVREKADVGIALDGDADRIIMVDEQGWIVNGDHILAIAALHMKRKGKLAKDTVVVTDYTNKAFDVALKAEGISTIRTENGDRYVIEAMRKDGLNLGGEITGHIIFHDHTTTGDGTIAGLQILQIMQETKKPLSRLAKCFTPWPQVLKGIPIREKIPLAELNVSKTIADAQSRLGSDGRVFVRYSGTEKKVRILVECLDATLAEELASAISKGFQEEVGV